MIKKPPVRNSPPVQSQTIDNGPQQFNATPRFNFSSTPRPTQSQNLPASTPSAARYLTPARRVHRLDEIADISSDGLQDVQDSIEAEEHEVAIVLLSEEDDDESYKIKQRSPKRQRFSSSADEFGPNEDLHLKRGSSPLPLLSSPPASRRPASSKAPKFIIGSPANLPTPTEAQSAFVKPPRFRQLELPDHIHSQQDPLPDQFSPHRRGQKYIPGGVAAEVRDWLMNMAPTPGGQKLDSLWLMKLEVEEVSGDSRTGMTMIRGSEGEGRAPINVLLAGEGESVALQKKAKVEVGRTVAIKGTVWDVMIERDKWGVSVEWKVLL